MFKWFRGESKEAQNIPEPPLPNLDVALKIRNNRYNPLYYYHSTDLNDEIEYEFQQREERKERKNERMRRLTSEIVDGYIELQHRRIEKIHRSIFLRKQVPKEYIRRRVLRQYRVRHEYIMGKVKWELGDLYRNLLILRLDKINHQMLMLVLQYEICQFYKNSVDKGVHQLGISFTELKSHAKRFKSFQVDKRLHKLYMRAIRKEIIHVGITYKEYLTEKETHRERMAIVLEELLDSFDMEISYSYSSSEEEYFVNNNCVNKHLKPKYEDHDFIQWGIIDPFVVKENEGEYTFFKTVKPPVILDFNVLPKNDFKFEKKMEKKMAKREGYLEIFLGPMFSGKSSKILFKLSCMADQRFRCLYVNNVKDVRATEAQDAFVTTHNSSYSKISPKITCVKVAELIDVDVNDFDYIAIDELQFFDHESTVQTIVDWVTQYGKYVLIASLDGDCYRRRFGKVLDLIPHANEVTKLSSYCDMCRDNYGRLKPAPFTARMTSDTTAELVGGTDLYKAMCRECHDFHLDVTIRKY